MSLANVPVNGDLVRQRASEHRLSDRDISRAMGLGSTASRSLVLTDTIHPSTPLAVLERLTRALGMTYGELLDPQGVPEVPADQLAPEDRVKLLAQALPARRSGVPLDHLAIVLGVTYDELRADLADVSRLLHPVGYRIHITCTGVVASRIPSPQADEFESRLNQFRDARDGMLISHARLLHRALAGALSTRGLSNDERVGVGYLAGRGALTRPASNQRASVSEDTNYCLFPPST